MASASHPNKFSAEVQDSKKFWGALIERAEKSGWDSVPADILSIPVNNEDINIAYTVCGRVT